MLFNIYIKKNEEMILLFENKENNKMDILMYDMRTFYYSFSSIILFQNIM